MSSALRGFLCHLGRESRVSGDTARRSSVGPVAVGRSYQRTSIRLRRWSAADRRHLQLRAVAGLHGHFADCRQTRPCEFPLRVGQLRSSVDRLASVRQRGQPARDLWGYRSTAELARPRSCGAEAPLWRRGPRGRGGARRRGGLLRHRRRQLGCHLLVGRQGVGTEQAVDAYVRRTSQLVAELEATRSPEGCASCSGRADLGGLFSAFVIRPSRSRRSRDGRPRTGLRSRVRRLSRSSPRRRSESRIWMSRPSGSLVSGAARRRRARARERADRAGGRRGEALPARRAGGQG